MSPRLARPRHNRVIAGVCAGIAERFGLSAWTVRLIFLASCLLPGPRSTSSPSTRSTSSRP
ncbi:PspC domain-containing protein [Kitasatospora sp. NPDC001660]